MTRTAFTRTAIVFGEMTRTALGGTRTAILNSFGVLVGKTFELMSHNYVAIAKFL